MDDLDDAPDGEVEQIEEEVVDRATAFRTIAELRTEIATLERLEAMAHQLRRSGEDRKWRELADLVNTEVFVPGAIKAKSDGEAAESASTPRASEKFVIFTEHRERSARFSPSQCH